MRARRKSERRIILGFGGLIRLCAGRATADEGRRRPDNSRRELAGVVPPPDSRETRRPTRGGSPAPGDAPADEGGVAGRREERPARGGSPELIVPKAYPLYL